ncbi:MAG TPA: cytochrome c oxidase assembly protein [Streptosporangiaceae bacterium]|nr:cytochrome c oxidase assembly protein [Streptosporangiaceae bacterium]
MRDWQRRRRWLALIGVVLGIGVLVPPVGQVARQYVFAQAIQFAALAIVVPALIVLGAPWRTLGRSRGMSRLADRLAIRRSHDPHRGRSWLVLAAFIAVSLAWRLPAAVNALVRYPALTVAEALTLVVAGCALWLELADSPPLLSRIPRQQRAAFAALPMWAIWASAYVMGFSGTAWFSALAHPAGRGLSTIADQQIAAAVLMAIPGLCFVPVVYVSLIVWLRDSADPDDELRDVPLGRPRSARLRPPRGWRLPPA